MHVKTLTKTQLSPVLPPPPAHIPWACQIIMLSIFLASLLLAVSALALPNLKLSSCNLSQAKLSLPLNQMVLVKQTSAPSFVGLGVGVQNYTCNATSLTYL